jgi:hypothetical protein
MSWTEPEADLSLTRTPGGPGLYATERDRHRAPEGTALAGGDRRGQRPEPAIASRGRSHRSSHVRRGVEAGGRPRQNGSVARYTVNERAVARARELITARQYVLRSDWGDVQPSAADENRYLEKHSWDDYAAWHLGLTESAVDETKARYGFVYGDFRRLHRSGLIACQYRAAEWRHKEVELAAHDLLQLLDRTSG